MSMISKIITIIILLFTLGVKAQTMNEVYDELVKQEVKNPKIVLQQVAWETGWLKCNWCSRSYNNLFGFRLNKYVSKNNPQGYIPFKDWKASIKYYKKWQDKYYDGKKNYYRFLDCLWVRSDGTCVRYASDKQYTQKIRQCKVDGFCN